MALISDIPNKDTKRSPGLDLARTLAIAGVLCAHFPVFLAQLNISHETLMPLYIWGGYYGVELFFVLSGYLIGGILIRDVLPMPSSRRLMIFCIRRWLRTLPAYYTVLFCLIIYAALYGNFPSSIWKYFIFLQNSPPEYAVFFPVSWSLSIEEWSYLFILVLLCFKIKSINTITCVEYNQQKKIVYKLIFAIIFFSLYRFIIALMEPAIWDDTFRKQVFVRLDAVLYGVLAFAIKTYYPKFFKKISQLWVFCVSIFLLQCIYLCYDISLFQPNGNLFIKSFAFSLVSTLMAIALCFFDINPHLRRICAYDAMLGWFCLWGSRLAYSLYLLHFSVFTFVVTAFYPRLDTTLSIFAAVGVSMSASITLSFILYNAVEKPGMNFRRKFSFDKGMTCIHK